MNPTSKISSPTVLITGASGLSGFLATKQFAINGYPVKALIRNSSKENLFSSFPNVTVFTGDMSKPESTKNALEGVEKVFLISTANNEMDVVQCQFIDACKAAGVKHIIKFSGAEPNFAPNAFLFTKMHEQIEDYLEASGMLWTHLRPSQFMQVYLRELPTIERDSAIYLPFENIQLAPVDIADIAKIAFQIITNNRYQNESINFTGPEALTMEGIASAFSDILKRPIKYIPISVEERHKNLMNSGLPEYFVNELDQQTIERLRRPFSPTITGIFDELHIVPTTFKKFLSRNLKKIH